MKNYFSHDSDARNSRKMLRLRKTLGAEGYGTYWMLIERLREEDGYQCEADYEMLAFDLRVDAGIIKSVIEDFGLFNIKNGIFYSDGLVDRMDKANIRSDAGKKGAESRWGKKDSNTPDTNEENTCEQSAEITPEDSDVVSKERSENPAQNGSEWQNEDFAIWQNDGKNGKKRKEEARKENKLNKNKLNKNLSLSLTPSLTEGETDTDILSVFFFEKGYRNAYEEAKRFLNFYVSNGQLSKMDEQQLAAKARIWEPRDKNNYIHPRFTENFKRFWYAVYSQMKASGAPITLLNAVRGDDIEEGYTDPQCKDTYCLKLPGTLVDYFETNSETYARLFMSYIKSIGLTRLAYAN